jgi:uncharacterized membrane protein YphA (DoxX/SURF4 family)
LQAEPAVTFFALVTSVVGRRRFMQTKRLIAAFWALRIGLGGAAFLAGVDKFFNLLANWPAYLTPIAARVVPITAPNLMHVVGVVEMAVGLAILAGMTRLGGYVATAWLVCIALNLVTAGQYFDVAVRDVEMAIAAFTLARLTEAGIAATSDAVVVADRRNSIRTAAA